MNLEKIFTTKEMVDKSFPFMSLWHTIPLILIALSLFIIIKNKEYIKIHRKKSKLVVGILLLICTIMKQSWYLSREIPYIYEGLPIYLCRLTILITVIGFIFDYKKLNFVIIYQGTFGGLMALLLPDIGGYLFPHFFYTVFFFSHALLLTAAFFVLECDEFIASKKELTKMVIYNFFYVLLVDLVNIPLASNYGYTMHSPDSLTPIIGEHSGFMYKIIVFLILCLLGLFAHLFYKFINYRRIKALKYTI